MNFQRSLIFSKNIKCLFKVRLSSSSNPYLKFNYLDLDYLKKVWLRDYESIVKTIFIINSVTYYLD